MITSVKMLVRSSMLYDCIVHHFIGNFWVKSEISILMWNTFSSFYFARAHVRDRRYLHYAVNF